MSGLRARINWLWRLIATAIAFSSFGIGGSLLGLTFPLLNLLTPRHRRQAQARRVVHTVFAWFMRWMRWLGILEWRIEGAERLGQPGQLVVANHPSLLDVVFMMAHIREPNCIVKRSLWRNPCMIGPVSAANFIPNGDSERLISDGCDSLQAGDCLIVFPEGTRTTPGQRIELQRGAATIAIKGAKQLTPVLITVSPTTLTKSEKWYNIPRRRFVMSLRVLPDIDLGPLREQHSAPVAARKLNQLLTELYSGPLPHESDPDH